jgi:hypothetical protein
MGGGRNGLASKYPNLSYLRLLLRLGAEAKRQEHSAKGKTDKRLLHAFSCALSYPTPDSSSLSSDHLIRASAVNGFHLTP